MFPRWLLAAATALVLSIPASLPALAQAPQSSAAQPGPDDRAKQWLGLIDDSNYAESYKQMGAAAQARIGSDAAAQKLRADREPLGAMATRNLKDVKLAKTMRGMPDGQYAVVRFDSGFAHKASAIETVTLVSTKNAWTVIGYHID